MAKLIKYLYLFPDHLAEDIILSTNIKYMEKINKFYPLDKINSIRDNLDRINFILDPGPNPDFGSLIPYEGPEKHTTSQAETMAELINEDNLKIFKWLLPKIYYKDFVFDILVPKIKNLDTYKRLLSLLPKNPYIINSGLTSAISDGNRKQLEFVLNYIKQNNIRSGNEYINDALQLALDNKEKEMAEILLELGAKVQNIRNVGNTDVLQDL